MSAFVDLLAIVFTWCRTRAAKRPKFENRSSVTDVLLRDGALYFCVLLFLNVITFMDEWGLQALNTYTIYMLEIIAQYQTPLLSITVSHFLLNLRAAAYGTTSISDSQQTVTDIAFNACDRSSQPRPGSFVEPLGASLSDGSDDIDEDRVWDDVLHVRVGSNEEDA
ncbi:hypothetical protein CERSUDRAFT_97152 [Gelatoporia subvermispora B]|uniref:Uncharacterized protein n=1 Tax=Ceriporiopsis subvermispora (strain B) TaxID=914234 RepID=M2QC29_CERS8|nr:hypothetical protein CERSUDRAFT_97152 [Gelatoporia subvermispora B]